MTQSIDVNAAAAFSTKKCTKYARKDNWNGTAITKENIIDYRLLC